MSTNFDRIASEALALPTSARASLAEQLLESLDEPESNAVDEIWADEAEQRCRELDEGVVQAIPGDEALRRGRARLELHEGVPLSQGV